MRLRITLLRRRRLQRHRDFQQQWSYGSIYLFIYWVQCLRISLKNYVLLIRNDEWLGFITSQCFTEHRAIQRKGEYIHYEKIMSTKSIGSESKRIRRQLRAAQIRQIAYFPRDFLPSLGPCESIPTVLSWH